MKVTIEVIADDRDDVLVLLRAAVRELKSAKEKNAEAQQSCLGVYRVVVEEEQTPEPPHAKGDRVVCVDRSSAYFDTKGTVEHSGPRSTGVVWDGSDKVNVRPNAQIARVSA